MIGEVLTAFVRSHAPWPPGEEVAAAPTDEVPELQVRAADVQASLTVLGRGGFAPRAAGQDGRLDLHGVDLRRANLSKAHLEQANLFGAHLEETILHSAHLAERRRWLTSIRSGRLGSIGAQPESLLTAGRCSESTAAGVTGSTRPVSCAGRRGLPIRRPGPAKDAEASPPQQT
jgi:Pentapeptide repeats (8 copies)